MRKIIAETGWYDRHGNTVWKAYEVSEDAKKGKLYFAEFFIETGTTDTRKVIPMELKESLLAAIESVHSDGNYFQIDQWMWENEYILEDAKVVWKSKNT